MVLHNYDGNFLSFLIIVVAILLFIATALLAFYLNVVFILTGILLLVVIYGCVYHYKDRTQFIFTRDTFIVQEGMYKRETSNVKYKDIVRTERVTIPGFTYASSKKAILLSIIPIMNCIFIKVERILVTKDVGPNGHAYVNTLIQEKIGIP